MGSDNGQNKDLQGKQASLLDQTYTPGWMDGYSEGYGDVVDGSQNALNKLESGDELLDEVIEDKDNVINEMASSIGRVLQTVRKSK